LGGYIDDSSGDANKKFSTCQIIKIIEPGMKLNNNIGELAGNIDEFLDGLLLNKFLNGVIS